MDYNERDRGDDTNQIFDLSRILSAIHRDGLTIRRRVIGHHFQIGDRGPRKIYQYRTYAPRRGKREKLSVERLRLFSIWAMERKPTTSYIAGKQV